MRLNRYLASCGVCSRRAADELIAAGRVRVGGRVARVLGSVVEEGARVEVDGVAVQTPPGKTYLVLHKPVGVVTTMRDPQGRRTVRDLLPLGTPRIVPVGRLDYDTSGVLLFTDDGDLAHRLLHPRYGVEKTYRAFVSGSLTEADRHALRSGVRLGNEHTQPARLRVLRRFGDAALIELTLREGRNRQVRRMFERLGHDVRRLERIRFGPILLAALEAGKTRPLSKREIESLRRIGSGRGVRRRFSNPTPLR